jgi:2-oxoglutarate dehydrogenase E2 component (dihydrolipoamide succinyltransferase)
VAVGDVVCLIDTDEIQSEKSSKENIKKESTPKDLSLNQNNQKKVKSTPLADAIIKKNNLDLKDLNGSGEDGKITKNDVLEMINNSSKVKGREYTSKKMSSLRRKIATRLVAVKNETAMLTTFNEVDMSSIMNLRSEFKQKFIDKHDINLGFMSFFTKAVTTALLDFPDVNAMIEGENIIHFNYMDIGIAVSAPKGLMVPVVRNAQDLTFKDVESEIKRLAIKARDGKITVDEMLGGTFTITNGGVFGSMLSTPIINPPQSAILGMHNIVERPVVISGKVVVRPIMYLALSYDHRIIDGKSSVGFLCKVKECLEDPQQYLMNNNIQKALEL